MSRDTAPAVQKIKCPPRRGPVRTAARTGVSTIVFMLVFQTTGRTLRAKFPVLKPVRPPPPRKFSESRFRGLTPSPPAFFAPSTPQQSVMAKSSATLDWCIVRLGEDHNWWVDEVSDPVRWDVDGLSIIDPRQMAHLIELVEPLRDYGFDQDTMEAAFILFRIEREAGEQRVRLKRVKDSFFESEEKLFALADIVDEENGPYADLLDHLTRCRVKMLNDIFKFESKLTVDEVEDEIREDQNASFIEGKAIHTFEELCAILDYVPAGWESEEGEDSGKSDEDIDAEDLPELDADEEERLKNDQSLKWDDDEESDDEEKPEGDDEEDEEKEDSDSDDDDDKPKKPAKRKR
jgi:hypothetical protein